MRVAAVVAVGVGISVAGLVPHTTHADRRLPVVAVPVATPATTDTLRALDRLHSYGYTISTPRIAERAIRHWQQVNGLTVDGIVGPQTLASLGLGETATPTTPLAPAVPAGSVVDLIRSMWPDDTEDRAVAIAWRESRHQPEVINRNGNATGLFQIMWTVHRGWLCPQLGICQQSDLQDAATNIKAAIALYNRAGGFGPWSL